MSLRWLERRGRHPERWRRRRHGGGQADYIWGASGNDTLRGGAGDDYLYGGGKDDLMFGGFGNDYLAGGFGNDTLSGGAGMDQLDGAQGTDLFVMGADGVADMVHFTRRPDLNLRVNAGRVEGFETGLDRINLGLFDTDRLIKGVQTLGFVVGAAQA